MSRSSPPSPRWEVTTRAPSLLSLFHFPLPQLLCFPCSPVMAIRSIFYTILICCFVAAVPGIPAAAQFPPQLPPGYAAYAQASPNMGSMAPPQTSGAPGYGTRSSAALDASAAQPPYNSRSRTPTAPRTSGAAPMGYAGCSLLQTSSRFVCSGT